MVSRLIGFGVALTACVCLSGLLAAQSPEVSRILTVRDGLPQSFVSGISQDKNGFLWIATLNGFSRYDGRQFIYYRHTSADSTGLSGNIVLHLFDAGNNDLLLCYADGKVDRLNTVTGKVVPIWKNKGFDVLAGETSYFKSLVGNREGVCWMIAGDGGIYRIDLNRPGVKHLSVSDLRTDEAVVGIAIRDNTLFLFTKTRLCVCDSDGVIIKTLPYPFKRIDQFSERLTDIYSPGVRPNGDFILMDSAGIKIWNPGTGHYQLVLLARNGAPGKLIAQFDRSGNFFFKYNEAIYLLRPTNELVKWSPANPAVKGIPTSMYVDRSGVLWVGTNGYGLRQYNLLKTGLHGYANQNSFIIDVLSHYGVPAATAVKTFLGRSVPFANRIATFKDSVWIADVNTRSSHPPMALFTRHTLTVKTFHVGNAGGKKEVPAINFLSFTPAGVLWGIDQHFRLLKFNTQKSEMNVFATAPLNRREEINGMAPEGETAFYISTNKSLVRIDALTGHTENLTPFLPSKDLLTIGNDPVDKEILWIGTLSDGLILFDKNTKKTQVLDIATGLPNNTIYSILPGDDNWLWCSSNKGIFAFNKKNQTVRSFTSRDGLIDDEFNRYYYAALPDGNLCFGGPLGYTLFNPSKLETDAFDPQITLTGLNVINLPATGESLTNISGLHLRYDQNFINAEFAAMQFDFPEKIQYRHMLAGFDKDWVLTGSENKASYTSLPAGGYTLLLNASNTNGKWSRYSLRIAVIISPPFWKTGWFYAGIALLLGGVMYLFLHLRIRSVKVAHAQKLQFEREAMELHAMALRARMNPHFIFNCLNSIKALIQERQDRKAVDYLNTFGTLIRKQLNNTGNQVSLLEELETCKLYLELEAMRFDGRIAHRFEIEKDELFGQIFIPPLILQPIVENAIVHGLLPAEEGGLVSIRVYREEYFIVCEIGDNGIGRTASAIYKQKSSRLHLSKGLHLLEERIATHNRLNEQLSSLQTVDRYHPDGRPSGTLVILKFNVDL